MPAIPVVRDVFHVQLITLCIGKTSNSVSQNKGQHVQVDLQHFGTLLFCLKVQHFLCCSCRAKPLSLCCIAVQIWSCASRTNSSFSLFAKQFTLSGFTDAEKGKNFHA